MPGTLPLSIVVLTKNEERNLADCLKTCGFSDDVHVLDSGSIDQTVEIAKSFDAHVHVNPFESFGQQRNWAIDHCDCKYPWHFHLDADERFTDELAAEIAGVIGDPKAAAYLIANKLMFGNHWLKFSAGYPVYQVRLFDAARVRFADVGHGQREVTDGPIGMLQQPYLHFGFSQGLLPWLRKHNEYSSREAAEAKAAVRPRWRDAIATSSIARRRAMKQVSFRLRGRGPLRFAYQYGFKQGFRDGPAGRIYLSLIGMYESWIERKIWGHAAAVSRQIDQTIEAADGGTAVNADGKRMIRALAFLDGK